MAVEALASLFRSEHSESLHAVNAEIIAILNKRLFESCAMSSDAMCGAMFRLFSQSTDTSSRNLCLMSCREHRRVYRWRLQNHGQ